VPHVSSLSPHKRVMSLIWTIHVTHMKDSRNAYPRFISHMWMSHVTSKRHGERELERERGRAREKERQREEKRERAFRRKCSPANQNLVQRSNMNDACHTRERYIIHISKIHITPTKQSCHVRDRFREKYREKKRARKRHREKEWERERERALSGRKAAQ